MLSVIETYSQAGLNLPQTEAVHYQLRYKFAWCSGTHVRVAAEVFLHQHDRDHSGVYDELQFSGNRGILVFSVGEFLSLWFENLYNRLRAGVEGTNKIQTTSTIDT